MKSLPLADLEVVCIVVCIGEEMNDETGNMSRIMEDEVLNPELMNRATFGEFDNKCDCCGQRLKYNCLVVHVPTLTGYNVGRSCAAKIECLKRAGHAIENASLAVAERAKCNRHEAQFIETHCDETVAAYIWAKTEREGSIARDMVEKLRRWGSLSAAQTSFLCSLHAKHQAKLALAAAGVKCPVGKVAVAGTILSLKERPGYARGTVEHKIVVDLGNGTKVWGSLPTYAGDVYLPEVAKVGDRIAFSATVKASDNDPLFGFFKRPTKTAWTSAAAVAV